MHQRAGRAEKHMHDADDDRYDEDSFHEPVRSGPGVLGRLVLLVALGALASAAVQTVANTHRRRTRARPAALPERLQTWEGEGGRPDPDPNPGLGLTPDQPIDVGDAPLGSRSRLAH